MQPKETEQHHEMPTRKRRWYRPSKGAIWGLLFFVTFVVSFAAWLTYSEHTHGKRLEALIAIHKMGGTVHRNVSFKDEVEGDFLEIDMRNTQLTDADVEYIITLGPKERLMLGGTQLTESGLKRLQQALPNCKIDWQPPTSLARADDSAVSAEELHRLRQDALKLAADATSGSNVSFIAEEWPPDGLETTIVSLDQGLVTVQAGIDDGLYTGHRLSVERKGRKIATLLVIKANHDFAQARIITTPKPALRVGDLALGIGNDLDRAAVRAERLKSAVKSFQLRLDYNGEETKPYNRLTLTVAPVVEDAELKGFDFWESRVQITEAQARKIIDHLASPEWFLRRAMELPPNGELPPLAPYMQNYILTVSTKDFRLWEDWGWHPVTMKRLKGLRGVLEGDAKKGMDRLIERLRELDDTPEDRPKPR